MTSQQETLAMMALHRLFLYEPEMALQLWRRAGSAAAIMQPHAPVCDLMPEASARIQRLMVAAPEMMHRAEVEMDYNERHAIRAITFGTEAYPTLLSGCADAPLVLYVKGQLPQAPAHAVSIVGTRRATAYGRDLTRRFVEQLHAALPDAFVVSGLAYGIDIEAHRAANNCHLATAAVLAHGLDELYPTPHRADAERMLDQGGALITEHMTQTRADKLNFVRRNRIVAGLCQATVLVESAAHGGGLITARIASDYHRDVFAFPGAVGAPYSEGCNALIQSNSAQLITSAQDLMKSMNWTATVAPQHPQRKPVEPSLFPDLTAEEQQVAAQLRQTNDLSIDVLTAKTGMTAPQLMALLFSMEMKGAVRPLAGGTYHLLL